MVAEAARTFGSCIVWARNSEEAPYRRPAAGARGHTRNRETCPPICVWNVYRRRWLQRKSEVKGVEGGRTHEICARRGAGVGPVGWGG